MPLGKGVRYRVVTRGGKKIRLAFRGKKTVVEAKNLKTGATHTASEFARERRVRRVRSAVIVLALLLGVAAPVWAGHRTATWTAPTTNEDGTPLTDLSGYRLYRCTATPCLKSVGTLISSVPAPTTSVPLNHGQKGFLAVTAVDTAGNESAESNTVAFDLVGPAVPSGLTVQ